MKKFLKQKNGGFTLLEVLVAISIFTVSVLALLVILSQSITNTTYAKKKIIAGYLSQEGIEYVRNMRDTFVLYDAAGSQHGWNAFKSKLTVALCQNTNGCYFDDTNLWSGASMPMTTIAFTACGASSCPAFLYDSTSGLSTVGRYNYTRGDASGFVRKININQISSDEIKISSTVYWLQGSVVYSLTLSENLTNWTQ